MIGWTDSDDAVDSDDYDDDDDDVTNSLVFERKLG